MYYLHIPIKTKDEGCKIAEDIFGTMYWRRTGIISVEAYPYDNDTPVRIDASQQAVAPDACNCGSKRPFIPFMPLKYLMCPDCKGRR